MNAFAERVTAGGVQLRLELVLGGDLLVRERHLLHLRAGRITWHVIYPERVPADATRYPLGRDVPGGRGRVVSRSPMAPGFSGAPLEKVVLEGGRTLIVKHVAPCLSWIMRATRDDGREARLWTESGYRPGDAVDAAVVGATRLEDGWLLYMNDVSDIVSGTAPVRDPVRALGALYAGSPLAEPPGLCALADRLRLFSPATARREATGPDLGPKIVGRGWELIRDLVPADLFELAHELALDPAPLVGALLERPCAVIHGDLRPGNVGLRGGTVVLIDWGLVTWAPPALDVAWYMFNRGWPEDAAGNIGDVLGSWWEPAAVDLAIIATFMQVCPYFGFNAVQEVDPDARRRAAGQLEQWVVRVRESLERSGFQG